MKLIYASQTLDIPSTVDLSVHSRTVTVKGKHGTITRNFSHLPIEVTVSKSKRKMTVGMWFSTTKQRARIRTFCSHVANMIKGVTHEFQYKMRFVYAHFPINSNIVDDGHTIEVRNFMGEKRVRKIKLLPGVQVEKSKNVKDEIVLTGVNIEAVSKSAALIHQSTLVKNKDIRKFLDGIYVSEKGIVGEE